MFDPAPVDDTLQIMHGLFRGQTSLVLQDVSGDEGDELPDWIRGLLREAGIASILLAPFGVGDQMLGFVVAHRLGVGRPWTVAEVDAVESIAADTGRGLHHARLYEAENRLVADLKSLDQAKSDFFATVSHELRAPLTSIEGYVEMLGDGEGGPVTADQHRMLDAVDRNAVRLRSLIDDVFTLSKLESGAFTTARQPVDIGQVIAGAVEELRPSVTGSGLALTSECAGHGLTVRGDRGQLDRVLVNLLSNAVKFTPAGGRIAVTAVTEDGTAVIEVSDTGIGIPDHDQKELFTRFFRASNAVARSIPGTGLGLAIVRTIVTNHGGEIDLHSQEAVGTVATVKLPLLEAGASSGRPLEVAAGQPAMPDAEGAPGPSAGGTVPCGPAGPGEGWPA
jgi:signal transduction histidine kinase